VTYHLVASELVAVDREIGPDYKNSVLEPIVQATLMRVLAEYRSDELDTPHIREAQDKITRIAAKQLLPYHIVLEAVDLKGIFIDLPGLAASVSRSAAWEQSALEAKTRVELARKRAEGLHELSLGIAAAHRAVLPTLTAAVLEDLEDKAWQKLTVSPHATTYILKKNDHSLLEVSP
jgi:hypothetical protein